MFSFVIYKITNPEGFVYIGRTNDIIRRKRYYKSIYNKKYAGKSDYLFDSLNGKVTRGNGNKFKLGEKCIFVYSKCNC